MLQVFKKIFLKKIILSYHNSLTPPPTHTHTHARAHTHTHTRTHIHTQFFLKSNFANQECFPGTSLSCHSPRHSNFLAPALRMQSCQLTKKTLPNMLIQVFCLQPSFSQDASRWLLPKRLWNCANTLLL